VVGELPLGSGSGHLLRNELDEVSARVVEHGDQLFADVSRRLRKDDARRRTAVVLGVDVVDRELRFTNPRTSV